MDNQQYYSPKEREEIEKGTADLEAFLAQMGQPNTITTTTPTAEMNDLLDAYQERLIDNVKDADLYQDINVVPFMSAKMKAVIDWFDLRFTVDPMQCTFYNDPKA